MSPAHVGLLLTAVSALAALPHVPAAWADEDPPGTASSACPGSVPVVGGDLACSWTFDSYLVPNPVGEAALITVFIGFCDCWLGDDPDPTLFGIPCVVESESGCITVDENNFSCWEDATAVPMGRSLNPPDPERVLKQGKLCVAYTDANGVPHGGNLADVIVPAAIPTEDLSGNCP